MKTELSPAYVKLITALVDNWLKSNARFIESVLTDVAEESGPLIAQEVHKNLVASFCVDSHLKRYDYMLKTLEWADSFLGELQMNGLGDDPQQSLRKLQKVVEIAVLQARGLPIPAAFEFPLKGDDIPF